MPTTEEWKTHLTERIQTIVWRPAMFGREAETTVVALLEIWAFATGSNLEAPLDVWRRVFCGGMECGPLFMRDYLESPHGRNLKHPDGFPMVERILGTNLASLARDFGLDVEIPNDKHP